MADVVVRVARCVDPYVAHRFALATESRWGGGREVRYERRLAVARPLHAAARRGDQKSGNA